MHYLYANIDYYIIKTIHDRYIYIIKYIFNTFLFDSYILYTIFVVDI